MAFSMSAAAAGLESMAVPAPSKYKTAAATRMNKAAPSVAQKSASDSADSVCKNGSVKAYQLLCVNRQRSDYLTTMPHSYGTRLAKASQPSNGHQNDEQVAARYHELVQVNSAKGYRHPPPTAPFNDPIAADMLGDLTPHYERPVSPNPLDRIRTRPIPNDVKELADVIKSLPCNRSGRRTGLEFPSRNTLRTDERLRGEVSRKTGRLKVESRGGQLRKWKGDCRLFEYAMWSYLCEEHYLKPPGRGLDGESINEGSKHAPSVVETAPEAKGKKRKRSSSLSKTAKQPLQRSSTGEIWKAKNMFTKSARAQPVAHAAAPHADASSLEDRSLDDDQASRKDSTKQNGPPKSDTATPDSIGRKTASSAADTVAPETSPSSATSPQSSVSQWEVSEAAMQERGLY